MECSMKLFTNVFLISFTFSLFLVACGTEIKQPPQDDPNAKKTTEPPKTEATNKPNPLEGVCSFSKNKGCIKATISSTRLSIDSFFYEMGIKGFAKNFPSDLVDSDMVSIETDQKLMFNRTVTEQNFHSNFSIIIEGDNTTYDSINDNLGNLIVNNVTPGRYTILLSKDFDLKVLDSNSKIVHYRCVTIWSRQQVDILSDQPTALPEAISEFNLSAYKEEESCSGAKVKTPTPTTTTDNPTTAG